MKEERFGRMVYIPGLNKGKYPNCNSLYIDDEKKAVIDPASNEAVLKGLNKKNAFDIIINSHYHEDHIALNYLFPDAELYVHKDDAPCFESLDTFLNYYGLDGGEIKEIWSHIMINDFHYKERIPSRELVDGDILEFGKIKLEVIHTPGHTKGHCSFYCKEEGVLFIGDLDLTSFGPWYGDRVSDIDDTIESIHRLMRIPAEIFITSHEAGIIKGNITGLAQSYLNVIDERESRLLEFLKEPRDLKEIVNKWIIYKKPRDPKYFYEFAEEVMIKKHLARLLENGRVEFKDNHYCLK